MVFGFDKPDINKLEKKNDVKGLIKALEYKKGFEYKKDILGPYKVRENAADALGNIGDKKATMPLINVLLLDENI